MPRTQLRATYTPIVNQVACQKQYETGPTQWRVTDRMICAGYDEGGRNSCNGDSGGPLLHFNTGTPKLVGLVSWARGCAQPKYPTVYSRVTSVLPWIKSTTGL